MNTPTPGLQRISRTIPVALQLAGLAGFVAAQILWLFFRHPEPEFMGICATTAATGYIGQGLQGLLGSKSSQPPSEPRPPTTEPPHSNGGPPSSGADS